MRNEEALQKIVKDIVSLNEQLESLKETAIHHFSDDMAVLSALQMWCSSIQYQAEQLLSQELAPQETAPER